MTGVAQLGSFTWRINPSQVSFSYDMDTAVINTIGGRVVQVYGATMGDLVIQGLFGQERGGQNRESWTLAEQFQTMIASMVEIQSLAPSDLQVTGRDATPMHQPFRFLYNDDTPDRRAAGLPVHNWDMQVYIKSLRDVKSPDYTVEHTTGKFSYGYTLTLFIVEDNTGKLTSQATDDFIQRLSAGVGWKKSVYNGPMTKDELKKYLAANSPDGTVHGLVLQQYADVTQGNLPGGEATIKAAADANKPATTTPGGAAAQAPATDPNNPASGTALGTLGLTPPAG